MPKTGLGSLATNSVTRSKQENNLILFGQHPLSVNDDESPVTNTRLLRTHICEMGTCCHGGPHSNRTRFYQGLSVNISAVTLSHFVCAFCMPQIPFAFEPKKSWSNGNCCLRIAIEPFDQLYRSGTVNSNTVNST